MEDVKVWWRGGYFDWVDKDFLLDYVIARMEMGYWLTVELVLDEDANGFWGIDG